MHNFKELKVWQRAMDLAELVYRAVGIFPKEEMYGLSSQIKRSAISIPSNISEGAGRATNNQFKYFLEIAMGSANELQSQIELSRRLKFISDVESESLSRETQEIYKMILGLYNKLK